MRIRETVSGVVSSLAKWVKALWPTDTDFEMLSRRTAAVLLWVGAFVISMVPGSEAFSTVISRLAQWATYLWIQEPVFA